MLNKEMMELCEENSFYGFQNVLFVSKVKKREISTNKKLPFVRLLKIDNVHIRKSDLLSFLTRCPNLEHLDVKEVAYIDDECLRNLSLRELKLSGHANLNGTCFLDSLLSKSLFSMTLVYNLIKPDTRNEDDDDWVPGDWGMDVTDNNPARVSNPEKSSMLPKFAGVPILNNGLIRACLGSTVKILTFSQDSTNDPYSARRTESMEISVKLLEIFPLLEELSCVGCELKGDKPFSPLKRLRKLNISQCYSYTLGGRPRNGGSVGVSDQKLEGLDQLRVLDASYLKIARIGQRTEDSDAGLRPPQEFSYKAFRNMKLLEELDLEGVPITESDAILLAFLPSLRKLNASFTTKEFIEKAIGMNLEEIRVCACDYHRPDKGRNYKVASCEEACEWDGLHFQCDKCTTCQKCEKPASVCELHRCVDCGCEFCYACAPRNACQKCGERHCKDCRKLRRLRKFCKCGWEFLCSKCLDTDIFPSCELCDRQTCAKCSARCTDCGILYCNGATETATLTYNHRYSNNGYFFHVGCRGYRDCKACGTGKAGSLSKCVKCAEIKFCERCSGHVDIEGGGWGEFLCSSCTKWCKTCEMTVCDKKDGCYRQCKFCKKGGCLKCFKGFRNGCSGGNCGRDFACANCEKQEVKPLSCNSSRCAESRLRYCQPCLKLAMERSSVCGMSCFRCWGVKCASCTDFICGDEEDEDPDMSFVRISECRDESCCSYHHCLDCGKMCEKCRKRYAVKCCGYCVEWVSCKKCKTLDKKAVKCAKEGCEVMICEECLEMGEMESSEEGSVKKVYCELHLKDYDDAEKESSAKKIIAEKRMKMKKEKKRKLREQREMSFPGVSFEEGYYAD